MVPHCQPALVPSSRRTTSSSPFSRPAPRTWCLTALQPLFLRRQAPRPPLQNAGHPRGRGAPLPSSPCFFVEEHHVLRLKMPTGPGGVVHHCPPALISSSRRTTSSASKCRAAPGTWYLTALQPLFLRRGAPRPPLQSAGHPRGRGASFPAIPCSFVRRHHVLRFKVPGSPGDVVSHCPPALISSSASTTSSSSQFRPTPGRGASLSSSPYSFVEEHHVLHSKVPGIPGGVVPHCPPALISSSSGTTSSAPKCRAAPGRGASFPAIPCSFVRRHHVRRLKHSTVLRMRPDVAKSRFFSINVY